MSDEVRSANSDDLEACLRIVEALPDYFTDDVPEKVRADLERHDGWIFAEAGETVGFVIVDRRTPQASEILWIAVEPSRRNAGVGTRLMTHVLGELGEQGTSLVEVKTLDRSADYEPYEATLAFYESNGFVQIDCIDPYADWEPGNPAAIFVAALDTTR